MELKELETLWVQAKMAEHKANEERLGIETLILSQIQAKDEGTVDATDTLKVRFGLTRSVDQEAVREKWSTLTQEQQDVFRWKADLSSAAMKKLSDEEYSVIAKMITAKPSKPSFSLKD